MTTKADKAEAISTLAEILTPGQTVYGILRTVARSGMSRTIDFYTVENGRMRYLTGYMAQSGIGTLTRNGIRVTGCGANMVSHCVSTLGRMIWPNGTPEPHGTGNGEPDTSGSYALRSEEL